MRFAPGSSGQLAESRANIGVGGMARNTEGANLSAYPVRRFAPQPHENSRGRKLSAYTGSWSTNSRKQAKTATEGIHRVDAHFSMAPKWPSVRLMTI